MDKPQEKKPCRRCLLFEAGEIELSELIAQRIALIPDEIKTPTDEYSARLSVCCGCDNLVAGTCTKCGCYAELRAAKSTNHCPDINGRW